jgi:hypothetical protein
MIIQPHLSRPAPKNGHKESVYAPQGYSYKWFFLSFLQLRGHPARIAAVFRNTFPNLIFSETQPWWRRAG